MQAESASDKDYVPLVNIIGLLFQILDDYLNLQSDQVPLPHFASCFSYLLMLPVTVHQEQGILRRSYRRKILVPHNSRYS